MTKPEPAAEWVDPSTLAPWSENPRVNDHAVDAVAGSISRFGFAAPIVARLQDRMVIAGHTRLKAAAKLGLTSVPVRFVDLSEAEAKALALADNRVGEIADWSADLGPVLASLAAEQVDLSGLGWDAVDLGKLIDDSEVSVGSGLGSLAERFLVPPFSVLNAREGWWQDRKRAWLSLGIQSELGRGSTDDDAIRTRKGAESPGGSPRPAMNYGKTGMRGDGRGRPIRG